jgi:hypothetical protein
MPSKIDLSLMTLKSKAEEQGKEVKRELEIIKSQIKEYQDKSTQMLHEIIKEETLIKKIAQIIQKNVSEGLKKTDTSTHKNKEMLNDLKQSIEDQIKTNSMSENDIVTELLKELKALNKWDEIGALIKKESEGSINMQNERFCKQNEELLIAIREINVKEKLDQ